jgi:hypothetical protein
MSNDIVTTMKRMFQMMQDKAELDAEKYGDPNWQLTSMHVLSSKAFNLLQLPDTSPETKHLILLSSFIGNQWVQVSDEPIAPLIFEDAPIVDWGVDIDES